MEFRQASKSSTFLVDTKGMCLLCYKECSYRKPGQRKSSQYQQSTEISTKFSKLLSRHLNFEVQRTVTQSLKNVKRRVGNFRKIAIELCEDCCSLASSFCDLYTQLELVRMRLDAYVKTISEIMKAAGRIPSRKRTYKQRMGLKPGAVVVGDSAASCNRYAAAIRADALADGLRKALISKCVAKLKSNYPRVKLRRGSIVENKLSYASMPSKKSKALELKYKDTRITLFPTPSPLSKSLAYQDRNKKVFQMLQNFILGYTFSFAFVFYLLLGNQRRANGGICVEPKDNTSDDVIPLVNFLSAKKKNTLGTSSNSVPVSNFGVLEESPNETREKSPLPPVKRRNHEITITDSGKTVLLPHQTFKMDADEFVDESVMDYEDSYVSYMNDTPTTAAQKSFDDMTQEPELSFSEDNENTCKDCRLELSSRAELEKHRVVIHKLQAYVRCPTCKEMFASYYFLKCHREDSAMCSIDQASEKLELEKIARPIFPFSSTIRGNKFCPMEGCFEVFFSSEGLQLHLKAHGSFECNFCKTNFDKGHDLAIHESQKHSGSNFSGYKCTRCNFHVGGQCDFILHFLNTHLNIDVFKEFCKVCKQGFTAKNGNLLALHHKTQHDTAGKDPSSIFKCDMCEAPFLKKSLLAKHQMYVHNVEREKRCQCNICGEELPSFAMLPKHKLRAHSNMPEHEIATLLKPKRKKNYYECHCGMSFTSRSSLILHRRIHEQLEKQMDEQNPGEETEETENAMV